MMKQAISFKQLHTAAKWIVLVLFALIPSFALAQAQLTETQKKDALHKIAGTWSVTYPDVSGARTYEITASGNVKGLSKHGTKMSGLLLPQSQDTYLLDLRDEIEVFVIEDETTITVTRFPSKKVWLSGLPAKAQGKGKRSPTPPR